MGNESDLLKQRQQSDFSELVENWNALDPAKIDDALYYQRNLSDKGIVTPEWFRAVVFTLDETDPDNPKAELQRFRKKLENAAAKEEIKGCCRVWMGIRKMEGQHSTFFEPFLEWSDTKNKTSIPDDDNCFKLKVVDHIALLNPKGPAPQHKHLRDFVLSSDIIPYKFALEMKTNWLLSSPKDMADHFKGIEYIRTNSNEQLPVLQYVKYYVFNSVENLVKTTNAIERIAGISLGMGLDLNKKTTNCPAFSPIMIYDLDVKADRYGGEPDVLYEELSRPCPPTC